MDLANTLIRSVVRAFYETRHILVVDALFLHSVYDELSGMWLNERCSLS
jgi:transcription initiation factor IIE alpha subunit